MNEVNNDNNKKRLKIYYSLLITVLCIIGVSFAWFRLYLSQKEDNTLGSRTCFDVSLTEETSKIELNDTYAIKDTEGLQGTPFTFTLKNNCSSYTKAYITIDSEYRTSTGESYLKDSFIKVNLSSKDTTDSTSFILGDLSLTDLENNRKGYIVKSTYLKPNEEKSYDLRVWIDSSVTMAQGLNKNWAGKIVVLSEASKEAAPEGWHSANDGTLLAAIRKNNKVTDTLTIPGKQLSDKKIYNQIDFDSIEAQTEDMTKNQDYFFTYATGYKINDKGLFDLAGDSISAGIYKEIYNDLEGKYAYIDLFDENIQNKKETSNLIVLFYITSASASSLTAKVIDYSSLTYETVTENVLATEEDDYGTTYYYRGAVKNNYVEFANKCWRIVRVAGDGSIKLVLHNDNLSDSENPCASANNSEKAAFAYGTCGNNTSTEYNTKIRDNAYIGFMYGYNQDLKAEANFENEKIYPTLLELEHSINYNEWRLAPYEYTHQNLYKSALLNYLEEWYEDNKLTDYENYLADTIWCNDKSTTKTLPSGTTYGTGLGYAQENSLYGAFKRIYGLMPGTSAVESPIESIKLKFPPEYANPSFKCPNDNNGGKLSKFTVDDTINGNGNLTYKIGLLTADEIAFSGAVGMLEEQDNETLNNQTYYLYENTGTNTWWTLSPVGYLESSSIATVKSGAISLNIVTDKSYLRPSLALSSYTKVLSGTGTSEDPYVITEFVKGKNYVCTPG